MSFRNRLPNIAIGFGIGIVATVLVLTLQHYQREAACRDGGAQHNCELTSKESPSVRLSPIQRSEGPNPEYYPDRKEWREEQDLQAQWQQAKWAKWAAFMAFLAVCVTGIGVVLIARTLIYTRDAAESAREMVREAEKATVATLTAANAASQQTEIARKSLQLSQGAFLALKEGSFKVHLDAVARRFDIDFRVRNIGKSIAIIERIIIKYHIGADLPDRPNYFRNSNAMLQGIDISPEDELHISEDPERKTTITEKLFGEILTGKTKYYLYALISYKDMFNNVFDKGIVVEIELEQPEPGKFLVRPRFPVSDPARIVKFSFFRERGVIDIAEPAIDFVRFSPKAFSPNEGVKIDFAIENISKNEVVIDVTTIQYEYVRNLPDKPNYVEPKKPKGDPGPFNLAPGRHMNVQTDPLPLAQDRFDDVVQNKRIAFVLGRAEYTESSGEIFEAGFLRVIQVAVSGRDEQGKATVKFWLETPPGYPEYNYFRKKPE